MYSRLGVTVDENRDLIGSKGSRVGEGCKVTWVRRERSKGEARPRPRPRQMTMEIVNAPFISASFRWGLMDNGIVVICERVRCSFVGSFHLIISISAVEGEFLLFFTTPMAISVPCTKLNFAKTMSMSMRRYSLKPAQCLPLQQTQQQQDAGIMCDACNGNGWLICDFCDGQKINVKAKNNRIYRRCPTCRAIGCILCSKCKVFKCVTFPDDSDGVL
ncbi:hypothetical protein GIB67_043175 [Kingdonia uniflora]|uniref:Uncharacterized protein n=1 Tax=Kingdonia uniflora TaxID=39325 RepID=A0A7J7NK09_9MAGN|nr:hypothetical protein GIB67_043175 [Kingdonia uniflora]